MGNCPSGDFFDCVFRQSYWVNTDYILPPLGADPKSVTVSGMGCGSFFAHMMHVIHSDSIHGAGLLAGGPYAMMLNPEIYTEGISEKSIAEFSIFDAKVNSELGYIDKVSNLEDDPVYIYEAQFDQFLEPEPTQAQKEFYQNYRSDVVYNKYQSSHTIPIDFPVTAQTPKQSCHLWTQWGTANCGYDLMGKVLEFLLTNLEFNKIDELKPKDDENWSSMGQLRRFDQNDLTESFYWEDDGLDRYGYAWLPKECFDRDSDPCKLHIHFHDCKQSTEDVALRNILTTGLVQYAATNKLIILFPQTQMTMSNTLSSFDFYQYTGSQESYTKYGVQPMFVKKMIERATLPQIESPDYDVMDPWWSELEWDGLHWYWWKTIMYRNWIRHPWYYFWIWFWGYHKDMPFKGKMFIERMTENWASAQ